MVIVKEPIFVLESAITKNYSMCHWLGDKTTAGSMFKECFSKSLKGCEGRLSRILKHTRRAWGLKGK